MSNFTRKNDNNSKKKKQFNSDVFFILSTKLSQARKQKKAKAGLKKGLTIIPK